MAAKMKNLIALATTGILTLFFGINYLLSTSSSTADSLTSTIEVPAGDTVLNQLFTTAKPDDSLPAYRYRQLEDSLNYLAEQRKWVDNGHDLTGAATSFLGAYVSDTTQRKPQVPDKYFLALRNYELHPDKTFFVHNNRYHLAYVVWDSTTNGNQVARNGHYAYKEIAVRYKPDEQMLLLPVSRSWFNIADLCVRFLPLLLVAIGAYTLIGLPLQIIWHIAKGNTFDNATVSRFHFMSMVVLAVTFCSLVFPYLLHFIFSSRIPADFEIISFWKSFINHLYGFIVAAGFYVIARAFERGIFLRQDQTLTI